MSFLKDHRDVLLLGAAATLLCLTGVGAGAVLLAGTPSTLSLLGFSLGTKAAGVALVTVGSMGTIATNVKCVSVVSTREKAALTADINQAAAETEIAKAAADKAQETSKQLEEAERVIREQRERSEAEFQRMTAEIQRLQEVVAKQARETVKQTSSHAEQAQDEAEQSVPSRSSRRG